MPSGSRKRKSLKKPKPGEPLSLQGEQPELEADLEESMAKDGEEMMEGSPSPRMIDGGSEAMAEERVEEGEELIGETSRDENEVAEGEEASAAPDHPEVDTRGPPSQTELVPEVPTIFESEGNGENEVEGETPDAPQGDPPPPIEDEKNAPPGKTSPDSEALPVEIKSDAEPDEELCALERDKDGAGAPPTDTALEADKDEPTEGTSDEIDGETQAGSEPRIDEFPVEWDRITARAQDDTGPEDDSTVDGITAVGVDPAVDETPDYTQQESDEATAADTDAASANIEPEETDVAPVATATQTNDGPASVQSEVDKSVVHRPAEEDAAAEFLDMDPELGAALAEMDKDPAEREVEADAPSANIEPEAKDDTFSETEAGADNCPMDTQSVMGEEAVQRQLETEAVPSGLEAGNDLDKEAAQVGEDASMGEIDQQVEPVAPMINSQTDAPESEIAASTQGDSVTAEPEGELTLREPESETGAIPGEFKPDVDAGVDDTEKDEVAEAETKSELNAPPIDAEQDETAPVVPQPETDDRASMEAEAEVEVENIHTSVEADADAFKEIDSEPERPPDASEGIEAVTGPTSLEAEENALTEASNEVTKELNQGVETSLETDTEPNGETTCEYELEAKAENPEPELEPEVELSSESKSDEEGSFETQSGQQDLIEVAPDQSYIQDQDQQQERETNSGMEGPELPATEANHEDSPAVSASSEAHLVEFSALLAPEAEAPAIADTSVPAIEPQTMEGGAASPPEKVVNDAADAEVVLDNGEGAIYEQLDEPKESIMQQESTGAEDGLDQEKASSGEFLAVSTERDLETEQRPTIRPDEVTLEEKPQATETESMLDKQDSTMDPRIMDVPSDVSEVVEQGLGIALPLETEQAVDEYDPKDEEQTLSGETKKDLGEEEASLSTVAEAGSVGNDFDENAHDQPLPTNFPSSEQDGEVSESREFDDTSSRTPTPLEAGLTEEVDGEVRESDEASSPRGLEKVGDEHADSGGEDIKVSLATVRNSSKNEVEWKAVEDLEPPTDHEEGSPESLKAEDPATTMLESHIELPVDVRPSEVSTIPDEEVDIVEAKDGEEGTAPPTLGIVSASESLAVAKEELMPKVLPSDSDGLHSLPSSETSTHDVSTPGEGGGNRDNPVVNSEKSEIDNFEANKDSEAVTSSEVLMNTSNGNPLLSSSPGQDIEDVQAFRQQKTQGASLPVIVPAQDVKQRSLEEGNFKGNEEHPSKGGTLQARTNLLGCCGMFDLLLGKDK